MGEEIRDYLESEKIIDIKTFEKIVDKAEFIRESIIIL